MRPPTTFSVLTTEPNAEVGAVHPKAMPVILRSDEEVETWMTAAADEALKLQRPLPNASLQTVASGIKKDEAEDPMGIPFMITMDQKSKLKALGLSDDDLRQITPAAAQNLLSSRA